MNLPKITLWKSFKIVFLGGTPQEEAQAQLQKAESELIATMNTLHGAIGRELACRLQLEWLKKYLANETPSVDEKELNWEALRQSLKENKPEIQVWRKKSE